MRFTCLKRNLKCIGFACNDIICRNRIEENGANDTNGGTRVQLKPASGIRSDEKVPQSRDEHVQAADNNRSRIAVTEEVCNSTDSCSKIEPLSAFNNEDIDVGGLDDLI